MRRQTELLRRPWTSLSCSSQQSAALVRHWMTKDIDVDVGHCACASWSTDGQSQGFVHGPNSGVAAIICIIGMSP